MKKIILLILCVIICFSLISCNYGDNGVRLPTYSDNFDKNFASDFFEYYYERDPQLFCLTSSAWEIGLPNEDETDNTVDDYYISTIDNTDKNLYVAVTTYDWDFPVGGGEQYSYSMSHVYHHINAPSPMQDWNIIGAELYFSDYELFLFRRATNLENAAEISQTYVEDNISSRAELVKKYEDSSSLSAISESYARGFTVQPSKYSSEWSNYLYRRYYLLLRFEENDNIVWCARVTLYDDGVYIEYTINEHGEGKSDNIKYLILKGEFGEDIKEQIIAHSGVTPPSAETSASTETTAYSSSLT